MKNRMPVRLMSGLVTTLFERAVFVINFSSAHQGQTAIWGPSHTAQAAVVQELEQVPTNQKVRGPIPGPCSN